jgi:hypothetical protein
MDSETLKRRKKQKYVNAKALIYSSSDCSSDDESDSNPDVIPVKLSYKKSSNPIGIDPYKIQNF